jgi:protein-tyrosine phosphatase
MSWFLRGGIPADTVRLVPTRILMVCTANVCRSPMAAAILQHHLDAVGIDAVVTSAGTRGPNGLPVDPEAVAAVSRWGIDLHAHQPRLFTKDVGVEEGADLIITMERQHLRHVVALDRRTWVRTYTLKELIRRIANAGPMTPGNLAVWTSAMGTGRRAADMMDDSPLDDIADPYGQGRAAVNRTADELYLFLHGLTYTVPWP